LARVEGKNKNTPPPPSGDQQDPARAPKEKGRHGKRAAAQQLGVSPAMAPPLDQAARAGRRRKGTIGKKKRTEQRRGGTEDREAKGEIEGKREEQQGAGGRDWGFKARPKGPQGNESFA